MAGGRVGTPVNAGEEIPRKDALGGTFAASHDKFLAIAYSVLRNREDAEDAVQEAFLSAYRHFPSFEGRSALGTWLARIVWNAALMIRRKRKASAIPPFLENGESRHVGWMDKIRAPEPSPEMVHAEREALQLIEGILGQMKPMLRQAFTMTYFDELSGPEACTTLGISVATFKARLFRAKRQVFDRAVKTTRRTRSDRR